MSDLDQAALLAHLPPHVRDEALRRVKIVRGYVRDKTRANAEAAAAELGLSVVHFKKIVQIWELHGRADRLPGTEWPKTKGVATTAAQMEIILGAQARLSQASLGQVVRLAIAKGRERDEPMPSANTIRARVREFRSNAPAINAFGSDADIVVAAAAIDLPVATTDGVVTMPLAALAIEPARRCVVALELSIDEPDARMAARVLIAALGRTDANNRGASRVAIDVLAGADWISLAATLTAAGVTLIGERRAEPRRDLATDHLGPKAGGIAIRPRLLHRSPSRRQPYLASGQPPLSLEQARDFAKARLLAPDAPVTPSLGEDARNVVAALGDWLAERKSDAAGSDPSEL